MSNFNAIESKVIVSGIKSAMAGVITTKAQLTKAREALLKAIAEAVPHAVFHASNAEGAAGNLTALSSLVVACSETEHPNEVFSALKKAVFKSIHGLKLTDDGKSFEFKLKGAAGKKKRNLIEGFEQVNMLDFYTPPEKSEKAKQVAPKYATDKTLEGFKKKLKHEETQDELILKTMLAAAIEVKNRHGMGVFTEDSVKALISTLSTFIEGESTPADGKAHFSDDSIELTANEAAAAAARGDQDAV